MGRKCRHYSSDDSSCDDQSDRDSYGERRKSKCGKCRKEICKRCGKTDCKKVKPPPVCNSCRSSSEKQQNDTESCTKNERCVFVNIIK